MVPRSEQSFRKCVVGFQSAVNIYANRLNSIESVIPYEYHSFDVCKLEVAEEKKLSPSENLGQVVFGERIRPSPYKVIIHNTSLYTDLCDHNIVMVILQFNILDYR